MEIVYYWVNNNRCIFQEGFNFAPEVHFEMSRKSNDTFVLEGRRTGKINIMCNSNNGVISNVTALVGMNGAGKTSLMMSLCDFNYLPLEKEEGDVERVREKNNQRTRLYIVRDGGKYTLITNMYREHLKILNSDYAENLIDEVLFCSDERESFKTKFINGKLLEGVTSIYLTNLPFTMGKDSLESHLGINYMTFYPEGMQAVSNAFFSFIYTEKMHEDNEFMKYSRLLKEHKTRMNFQQSCDLYYAAEFYDKSDSKYGVLKNDSFHVKVSNALNNYDEWIGDNIDGPENVKDRVEALEESISEHINAAVKKSVINELKRDFLVECILACPTYFSYKELEMTSEKEFQVLYSYVADSIGEIFDTECLISYFENAVKEIRILESIFSQGHLPHNTLPVNDWAYKTGGIITGNTIKEYLIFIRNCIESNHELMKDGSIQLGSFCLRYLYVDNLKLSSGERAYQNIVSWLYWISKMGDIATRKEYVPKDKMLICIDEIDSMCHPDWQKDIVGNIIETINNIFKDKEIQLVFSTHNPLCLSNVPVENTIYLVNDNNGIHQDKNKHIQTFGRNIYDILNDSFYLQGETIGKYALEYINNLITEVERLSEGYLERCMDDYIQKISYIGDPLICGKLLQLLDKRIQKSDKKRRREYLEKRKAAIDKEIEELGEV